MSETEEKLPVNDFVKVIDYKTIYKTKKWWCAVVLANMAGHTKIMIYQWQYGEIKNPRNNTTRIGWKRKQKFGVNFAKDWEAMKTAIEGYLPKISEGY